MIIRQLNYEDEITIELYEGLSSFETKGAMLVEARGVASYSKQSVVNDMVKYINRYLMSKTENFGYENASYKDRSGIHKVKMCKNIEIEIPYGITNKFTDFNNLKVVVFVDDIVGNIDTKNSIITSTGSNKLYPNNNIIDGKLQYSKITINCKSINHIIVNSDFFDAFNHEYNHAVEEYGRILSKEKNNRVKSSFEIAKYQYLNNKMGLLKSEDKYEKSFGIILYMLFSKKEFNAWVTSPYSYLKSIDSDRYMFSDDIKKCDAYIHYKYIKEKCLPLVEECDSTELWFNIYNLCMKTKIDLQKIGNEENLSIKLNKFKEKFIKKTKYLLDEFWTKMCRSASLWYDEKENNN